MFSGNVQLEKGVKIMNQIDQSKFPLLLSRISSSLSNSPPAPPFTPEEESKLQSSLDISLLDVKLLIQSATDIFTISAYYLAKPAVLLEQLVQLGLAQKKAEILVQVWTTSAKGIVDDLKQKSVLPQLSHVSYSLAVQTASHLSSKDKTPMAQLQLGLTSDCTSNELLLEFTHPQLYEFYQQLEKVQTQLDALR